jgi:DNA-binding transcriptional MerR regulator
MNKVRQLSGIREAVALAGSQKQLAEDLGVSKQAVQLWVKQGYVPKARIEEIERLYGIEPKRLFDPKLLELLTHKKDGSEE